MKNLLPKVSVSIIIAFLLFNFDGCYSQTNKPTSETKDELINESFGGSYCFTAKTSFARDSMGNLLPFIEYSSINDYLKSLPSDDAFIGKYPQVKQKNKNDMKRTPEENKNVQIDSCWIYDINHESDSDYHIIIGSTPDENTATFLNIEVSALPKSNTIDTERMIQIREELLNLFPNVKQKGYTEINPPYKVRVKGSAIFDGDHVPGTIGFRNHKPNTVWEVHPVYSIESI